MEGIELVSVVGEGVDLRSKVKVSHPKIAGLWVEFYDDFLASYYEKLEHLKTLSGKKAEELGYELSTALIADWNFADSNKEKLPVSVESVKKLPLKLQNWIAAEGMRIIQELSQVEKKD